MPSHPACNASDDVSVLCHGADSQPIRGAGQPDNDPRPLVTTLNLGKRITTHKRSPSNPTGQDVCQIRSACRPGSLVGHSLHNSVAAPSLTSACGSVSSSRAAASDTLPALGSTGLRQLKLRRRIPTLRQQRVQHRPQATLHPDVFASNGRSICHSQP